ncbi:FAD-dependent oxidoreductase [Chloroflexota bacterium]
MQEVLQEQAAVSTLLGMPEEWDHEADVIVVGLGGAGAAAAIEAHDTGADVLILEKMSIPGGCTKISQGAVYCGGSSLQKELGIDDSPDEVYKFYMAVANFEGELRADPDLVKIAAFQGPETFEWCKGLGIHFPANVRPTPPFFHTSLPGLSMISNERYPEFASAVKAPTYRTHWCDGSGVAFFDALETAITKRGINHIYEASVRSLIADSRRVVRGIIASHRGRDIYIKAKKAVILTTGGHGYNKSLVKGLPASTAAIESPEKQIPYSNTGDGNIMALALGADYWYNDGAVALPFFGTTNQHMNLSYQFPRIFVNKHGKRYVSEDWYFAMQAVYLARQPDMIGWAIIDDKGATLFGKDTMAEGVRKGKVIQAESIGDLAKAIGVDNKGLQETITKWNNDVAKGSDPEWNREWELKPLDTATFYATRVNFAEGNESTGVKINTKSQVIATNGQVIPGLYAAGRTSGGQFGLYPGCGTSIMTSLIFGRIAGKNAATEISR